jgi:autotransporter-associated beta strand protein
VVLIGVSGSPRVWAQTWKSTATGAWDTGSNWSTGSAPSSSSATAEFGANTAANGTNVNINTLVTVGRLLFDSGAPAYNIAVNSNAALTLAGAGIVNNSSNPLTLTVNASATVNFTGTATAANSILFLNSKGALDFSADTGTITAGSLQGSTSSNVFLGSRTLTVGSLNSSTLFQGVIADGGTAGGTGGSLVKVGTGTLTLDHNNTYTGNTTLSAGALQIGNGSSTGAVAGNIIDNAALIFKLSGTSTYGGVISGTGTVTNAGSGTVTFGGVNTYTGGTALNAGALLVAANNNLGATSGGLTFNGGTLQYGAGFTTARSVLLTGNGTFDTNGFNSTLSSVISGAGQLIKAGSGTLTLTNLETYTGSTKVSAGTLQVGNGATAGMISGSVTDNGTLAFNRSDNQAFAGVISGSGALSQLGSSTLTLTGANTYTGGTTINGGTLQIGSGGAAGSITGNIVNNSALALNLSSGLTLSGVISGSGALTQLGTGTVILTGTNTYTGLTTISAGTLQIGNGGITGSITGNIVDNGTVEFNRSDDFTFAGNISGSGSLIKDGLGTLTLTGNISYTGATTILGGALIVGAGGTTGSLNGDLVIDSNLTFNRSDDYLYQNVISGTGSLTKLGAGTLTFTGANVYTGGTTISAGALQLGNGGTTGSVVGDITDNSSLVFNHSDNVNFGGNISGTGSVTQAGSGVLSLTGSNNTYAGGTIINAGTVSLSADANLGASSGGITFGGGLLQLAANVNTARPVTLSTSGTIDTNGFASTFSGVISGSGGLNKNGNGTLTLTGANTYRGVTTINAGTLQIGSGGTAGALVGNVVDNSQLAFNLSSNTTYGGVISGTGSLTNLGTGPLVLTGTNTYTGVTSSSAGFLQLGNGGTSGSVAGNIAVDSALIFDRSDNVNYGGVISGAAAVITEGTGTLTLSGNNTYTGGTVVQTGSLILTGSNSGGGLMEVASGTALQIGAGGTSGSLAGNIQGGGSVTFDRSDSVTFAGTLIGSLSVIQAGSGTLTLTGTDNYSNGTSINSGTLQVGNGGTSGSITGNVTDNGTLAFNRSDNVSFGGVISGSGAVTQSGGTLTLSGNNTYSGTTTIASNSTLQVGNGGTSGTLTGNVVDNGVLAFNRADDFSFGGAISGTGSLVKRGAGTLTLTGVLSYTGTTEIDGGQLLLGNGGSINGNLTINTVLSFNRPDGYTYSGVLSGTGSVNQMGSGILVFTGNNLYTGGTTIGAGTLQLGNGGTSGSIVGSVVDNGALVFNRSDNLTFGGVISGTGTVSQTGGGTLTLTGTNTYTGGTAVTNGVLAASSDSNLGDPAGGVTLGGGTLRLDAITSARAFTLTQNGGTVDTDGTSSSLSGVISGAGSLTVIGSGSLQLTGANTYTGGTFVNNGTLIVNTNSLPGDVSVATALQFNQPSAGTYAGAVTGAGQLSVQGAQLTLTGTSTYSGSTIIGGSLNVDGGVINGTSDVRLATLASSNATLQMANPLSAVRTSGSVIVGQAGTGTVNISNGALLTSADGTIGSAAGSSGTVTVTGSGSLWSNANTLTIGGSGNGTLTVAAGGLVSANSIRLGDVSGSAGTLNIGAGAAGGIVNTATITGGQGATSVVNFNHSDAGYTLATQLGGNLAVNQIGPGTTILTADNTYTGVTTISGGTLQIGNGGTTGSLVGNIVDNGILAFNRSDDFTFGGNISGTGSLVKMGAGILTLTGSITYAGTTTILGGNVVVGNGGTTGSWNGNLSIDSSLTFNRSDDFVYGFVVSGTGSVLKLGTGTLTYTGTNTYTGGTTISVGTLQIGNGGTAGSVLGPIVDNANLTFNRSDDVGFAGAISGTGTVTKLGAGTLTLTSAETYSGGTVISAGTLQVGNGGTSGSLLSDVTDNGSLVFNRSDSSTFGGSVRGSGALSKLGAGTLVMTGNNTFSGATSINGTLQVSGGGQLSGTSGISVAAGSSDNGTLYVSGNGSRVSTVGTLQVGGPGNGALIVDNGATVSAGSIVLGTAGGTGSGTLNIGTGGTSGVINAATVVQGAGTGSQVNLNYTDTTYTLSSSLRNTLTLNQNGSGTTILSGSNTYSGGTYLNAGTLQVSSNGNLGANTAPLVFNGGTLQLSATITNLPRPITLNASGGTIDTSTFSLLSTASVSGTGGLTKNGSGVLTLNGPSSYTGGTKVNAGTLRGTTDSLQGNILNNATVAFLQSSDGSYSGVMSGTGTLSKLNTGNLTLSGANTYTGTTTVTSGTLTVNGSLSSPVTVGSSGTLAGSGTLNAPVSVVGTLSPGSTANPYGTLTVQGNLTLAVSSLLQINTSPTGQASQVNVTGVTHTASLNGGSVSVISGGGSYATNTQYTILKAAGGVNGTFSNVTADFAFLTPSLSYDAKDVFLTLQRNDVPFAAVAVGATQKAAARYFQSLSTDSGSSGLIQGIENLTTGAAPKAFDDLSGRSLSAASGLAMADTARLMEMLASRLGTSGNGDGTGLAFSTLTTAFSRAAGSTDMPAGSGVWLRQFATDGAPVNGGTNSAQNSARGLHTAGGFDVALTARTLAGISAAYTRDELDTQPGRVHPAQIHSPHLMAYASHTSDAAQLRGVLGCAVHSYEGQRAVTMGAQTTLLSDQHSATECSAYAQAEFGNAGVSGMHPLLGLLYSRQQDSRYSETGGPQALSIAAQTTQSVVSNAGLRYNHFLGPDFDTWHSQFEARAIWSHQYADVSPALRASLASATTPGDFLIPGQPAARDSAILGAGFALQIRRNFSVHLDYNLELDRNRYTQQALVAQLSYVH